jgi:preprotein translocase subunit SecD
MPDRRSVLVVSAIVIATVLAMAGLVLVSRRPTETTTMTVQAERARSGGAPASDAMQATRRSLLTRLAAAGLTHGTVRVSATRLVVRVDGRPDPRILRTLTEPGVVQLRRVLATTPDEVPDATSAAASVPATSREGVVAKLGPAYETLAKQVATRPDPVVLDAATQSMLAPFATLNPQEVALLPAAVQFAVPTIRCGQLDDRPPGATSAPDEPAVACSSATKHLLDVAAVDNGDLGGATAVANQSGQWVVEVRFTRDGTDRWTELSRRAVAYPEHRQVAVVVDDTIVDAPEVRTVVAGPLEVRWSPLEVFARGLAGKMAGGALPVRLTVVSIDGA